MAGTAGRVLTELLGFVRHGSDADVEAGFGDAALSPTPTSTPRDGRTQERVHRPTLR